MEFARAVSCWSLAALLSLFCRVPAAEAQNRPQPWKVGLGGGPAFLTQDAGSIGNTTGATGPVLDAVVVYEINRYFSLGVDVGYEQHEIEQGSLKLGDAVTVPLLVRFEIHPERTRPVSPYFLLASGYNLNSFREDDAYLASCGDDCWIDIDNTVTIRVGFGAEMFLLSDDIAFDAEVEWTYNKADMDFVQDGIEVASDDYDGSSLGLLLGFRYFFPGSAF